MVITTITSIDLASDIKNFISKVNVLYSDNTFRKKIFDSNDNSFLKITKTIGSDTTIIDVTDVDEDYVISAIRGE